VFSCANVDKALGQSTLSLNLGMHLLVADTSSGHYLFGESLPFFVVKLSSRVESYALHLPLTGRVSD